MDSSEQLTIAQGTQRESLAQRRTTKIVLRFEKRGSRVVLRRPQQIALTPANRAIAPPMKSAWYIQVWTTSGRFTRIKRHKQVSALSVARPRGILRQCTCTPADRRSGPYLPSSIRDTTMCALSPSCVHNRCNTASAPPSSRSVMIWRIFKSDLRWVVSQLNRMNP